jgi:hypothetical protein
MSELHQYLAAIMLDSAYLTTEETIGGSANGIKDRISKDIGGSVSAEDISGALAILEIFGAAEREYSPLTGGYWTINYDNFRYYFIESEPEAEDDAEKYAGTKAETTRFPVLQAYSRRGSRYAQDAAAHLKRLPWHEWEQYRKSDGSDANLAPASDRIVRIDDNQREQLSEGLSEISKELRSGSNELGAELGDEGERIAAEMDSGRALITSRSIRLDALVTLLMKPLKFLTEKFAGAALGELAKRLITELLKLIS